MKTLLQLILMLLFNTAIYAQQYYFAYVQTDNKQPFYIKVNNKLLSSSASGYVVIPKLSTGNYSLNIGFPKDQWPQQTIQLTIINTDAGFLLKNFGEKGWGLYNLQTMQVSMNNEKAGTTTAVTTGNDDVFTNTLSGAANTDLSVPKQAKANPVVAQETPKPMPVKEEPKVVAAASSMSITKINTATDNDGRSYTYVDRTDGLTDTINIFIAANKTNISVDPVKQVVVKEDKSEPVAKVVTMNDEKDGIKETKQSKFLDIDMSKPTATSTVTETAPKPIQPEPIVNVTKPAAVVKDKPVVNFNSDCKAMANDNDFLKIRKKMAAANTDDDMIDAAKKAFKTTCFSVEQIKNLSALFLNDGGKYNFFDAAYPRIYDSQNVATLQNLLSDQYYVTRFKAMIRN